MIAATLKIAAPARRGFAGASCIKCCHPDVQVSLVDTSRFHCGECDEDFTAADVKHHLAQWSAVLAWCAQAPPVGGSGADASPDAPAGR